MAHFRNSAPRPTVIILLCFVVSAIIRLGNQGFAVAEEHSASREETPFLPAVADSPSPEPDVGSLLASIRLRQEQLTAREIKLANRQIELVAIERKILLQLDALKQAESALASTLAIADDAAENDIKQLTAVYEKMKPKNAAEIFETMEISFAAGFLSRMRPESAAGILSEMPPNTAYSISVVMAGKNARAPTE